MFKLITDLIPRGDQPKAIKKIVEGIRNGQRFQTLLGVTGSGKTFTMANIIAQLQLPTLIISHNKTLAAQLYTEFKSFFPENAVCYFVSYYDYYQPEAYLPQTDLYIEKDASINDELDRLRLEATTCLITRKDVIIVASVSCIYNIGSPEEYRNSYLYVEIGQKTQIEAIIDRLIEMQYERSKFDLARGTFRVRGDVIEIYTSYSDKCYRIELFDDEVENIYELEPLSKDVINKYERLIIYPAKHFVISEPILKRALKSIEEELKERLKELKKQNKLLEAQRLKTRTEYDMELLRTTGYCHGIENYSRHFDGRLPGQRPWTLLDYFHLNNGKNFLLIIDESHVSIPQLHAMYEGDRARKHSLVEYGFRLPSAYDNRPLKFSEFERHLLPNFVLFVSATPGPYEKNKSKDNIVEQIIRPTGLVDPEVIVKPTANQMQDIIEQINIRAERNERVLITTLTKRMAEDLAEYLYSKKIRVKYLHSEIQTLDRVEILKELREGKFDCLVGINLLREGLDLPEVSLVIILDADKEGFLRSETSLIQMFGRAARHAAATVIMYADNITSSMQKAIEETNRRRNIQLKYNKEHNIIPSSIKKEVKYEELIKVKKEEEVDFDLDLDNLKDEPLALIEELEKRMYKAAENLEFEQAAKIRDKIFNIRKKLKLKNGARV